MARKRTRFLTNSEYVAEELRKKCDGSHSHVQLVSGRAAQTAVYTEAMCKAICRGVKREKASRIMGLKSLTMQPRKDRSSPPDANEFHDIDEANVERGNIKLIETQQAWDDVSGVELDKTMVKKAREEEMRYIKEKKVYDKISREEANKMGAKVIKVRWIDINKGDEKTPKYRSRLVAKEFREKNQEGDDNLFAGAPPLEALKCLLSEAATVGADGVEKTVLIADVSRAFFEADAKRLVCVELPEEDLTEKDKKEGNVGLLNKSMYGTRDAATNWQEEVAREMKKIGFRRGRYNPCVYWHLEKRIKAIVHGDDFVGVGRPADVEWMNDKLKERFQITSMRIGGGANEAREGRILNRIIRRTEAGWEYEADQRHRDLIVEALGLQEANPVKTPGEDMKEDEGQEELSAYDSTRYRAIVARANYLALDRPDVQYAVKELCRMMSAPRTTDWERLKRLGRYLVDKPRLVSQYVWQDQQESVDAYGDSDWAGCRRTGKSTSGGVLRIGAHVVKTWSHTQKTIALSSAEAELTALVKTACEGIGLQSLLSDWGDEVGLIVFADASAALGIVGRKGAGKLRHINISMLWIKDKQEVIDFRKVWGAANPADLMTKHNLWPTIERLLEVLPAHLRTGRADLSSEVSRSI